MNTTTIFSKSGRKFHVPYRVWILLVSILFTAIMLLSLLLFFSRDVSSYVTEKSSTLYILQTKVLSERIEHAFSNVNSVTNMILSDTRIRQTIKNFTAQEQIAKKLEPYHSLIGQLNRYALNQQNIANITILMENFSISVGHRPLLNQDLNRILPCLGMQRDSCYEQVQLLRSKYEISQRFVNSIPSGSLFYAANLYENGEFVALLLVGIRADTLLELIPAGMRSALYWRGELILGSAPGIPYCEEWTNHGEVTMVSTSQNVPHTYLRAIGDGSMVFLLQEDLNATYGYVVQFRKIMVGALILGILCAITLSMTLLRRVMAPMAALQHQISAYEKHEAEPPMENRSGRLSLRSRLSIYLACTVLVPILFYLAVYHGTANYCIGSQMRRNYMYTFQIYADSIDLMIQEHYDAAQMMGLDIAGMGTKDATQIQSRLLHDSQIWNLSLNIFFLDDQREIVYTSQLQNQALLAERIRNGSFKTGIALITEIPGNIFYGMEIICTNVAHFERDEPTIRSVLLLLEEEQLHAIYNELCSAELVDVYICDSTRTIISSNYANRIGKSLPTQENGFTSMEIPLIHMPFSVHFFYNEMQLTRGVTDIVLNRLQSIVLIFLSLAVFSSWLGRILAHPLERIRCQLDEHRIWDIAEIYSGNSLISEIDALGNSFNSMKQRIDELMDNLMRTQKKEYQMALDKMEAELHSLQLQIHPHFLCNLLESIRSLNELGNHFEANAMIQELGDFFRYSISHKTPIVLLREEIAFTRAYCNILRHKYRNGIRFIWNCDPAALEAPVLRLLMQPLIENAVRHGLAPCGGKGIVRISCLLQEKFLLLIVEDDGCGMDEKNIHQGIGLANVSRRIDLYYKGCGSIEIHSQLGKGTSVSLRLPVDI